MGNASVNQIKRMFLRFYPAQEQLAEEFASYVKTTGKPISMAQLQGHFMLFKEQPQDAISHVKLLYAS